MRPSFNVLNDPWIPVVAQDGERSLLGIRETLRRAPELKEISVVSPLEEFSVYRFLSVFLMDALRPKRSSTIKKLLRQGSFDLEQIEAYISLCEEEGVSFDLFDEQRPFMQAAYVKEWDKEPKPISAIDCFLPSGNNHLHFEHGQVQTRMVNVSKAVRLLLTIQQFCTAGAQGYPSGVNASPPYFGVVKGQNLFETLACSLLPLQMIEIPFDEPPVIWRSAAAVLPKETVGQTSWLRGMLFPARRVCLIPPNEKGDITEVYLSQGENFVNKETWTDPYVTYRLRDTGRIPLRPKGEKPVWRSMYEIADRNGRSQLLQQYLDLSDQPYAHITLYGVETNQASYLNIMRHDIRFRREITAQEELVNLLKKVVTASERLARKLHHCLRDENTVPEAAANDAVTSFYGKCETKFWELCENCAGTSTIQEQYRDWCQFIGQLAQDAFMKALQNVNLRGKDLGRAAEQQKWLSVEIKKIKEDAQV